MTKNIILKCIILYIFAVGSNSKIANILIFGGNGFIGSECVRSLLTEGYNITLISRGSHYYDYETRIKPYVTHVMCDRYHGLQNCKALININKTYDLIIDFTAYHPSLITDALMYFKEKFDTYIYISTDSVYEISLPSNSNKSKESDAQRHSLEIEQNKANEKDEYGHFKLQGEELLETEQKLSGINYVILRFPDVIGPRDTTYRWWAYQTWFQFYANFKQPMYLPKSAQSLMTSYVYVTDIAKIITEIVRDITLGTHKTLNQTFNFAFPVGFNLKTLLNLMQQALSIQGVEYQYAEAAYYLFPSVTRGPIDISKVQNTLLCEITQLEHAVQETVNFYNEAIFKFPNEREKMLKKFYMLIREQDIPVVKRKIEEYILKSNKIKLRNWHTEL